jgi:uncharacterized protein YjbJ (UPF0337 family)
MDKKLQDILEELMVCPCKTKENDGLPCPSCQQRIAQAKKKIKEMFGEMVGEDKYRDECDKLETDFQRGYNQRGEEIRNRVKEKE